MFYKNTIKYAKIQIFHYKKILFLQLCKGYYYMKRIYAYMKRIYARLWVLFMVVIGAFGSFSVSAQVDTAFWFAVPKLCDHAHWPITLVVSSFDQPATVTVTKAYTGAQVGNTLNIPANSSSTLTLVQNEAGLNGFECAHNTTSNYGLYIHSTAKVNAYVAVQQNNSEIYALKGNNGLGKHFFVTMQYQFDNGAGTGYGGYPQARNSAEIIATENNTTVTITPSVACGTHAANVPFSVTLNKGQVYCLASNSQAGASHLCGTLITSNKPIVVDVSDDSVTPHCSETNDNGGGSADLVADQLVPEEMAGGQYIVVPSPSAVNNYAPTSSGGQHYLDYVCLFGLEDSTYVRIYNTTNQDNPPVYTLNRGDKMKYHFTNNDPISIYATNEDMSQEKSIFVFQVTGAGKEFGGTQLPHVYCTGSTAASYRPLASANNHIKTLYLTLLCNAAYTSGFQINGSSSIISASDWHNVPGMPAFKYCCKNVSSNFSPSATNMIPFRVTNSLGKFHMGVFDINGSYDDCSISYFSSYTPGSFISWASDMPVSYCQGDTIFFDFDTVDAAITRIVGPNNFDLETLPYILADASPEQSGLFTVVAHDSRNCLMENLYDTIEIVVYPSSEEMIYDTICPGVEYTDNGFDISADRTVVPGVLYDTLYLQTAGFGCDSLLILELTVRDSVFSEFSHIACSQYQWNGHNYVESGDYVQTLTDANGCDSVVTMHLEIVEPEVTIVPSDEEFCEHGELILNAVSEFEEFIWNTGETTPYITAVDPGLYSVTVTAGECQASDHYSVQACEFHIYLPNTITPSREDGLNDCLYLPEYVHHFITDFDIEIFDRWGELIYKTNDMDFHWHGENAKVSEVYVWVVRVKNLDGKPFTYRGTITVL